MAGIAYGSRIEMSELLADEVGTLIQKAQEHSTSILSKVLG